MKTEASKKQELSLFYGSSQDCVINLLEACETISHSGPLNSNHPQAIARHSHYLIELIEKISPHLHCHTYPIGQRFTLSSSRDSKCYYIRTGAISLYRQPNDVLLELLDAPSIRGIIPIPPESASIYTLKVIIPAEIAVLDIGRLYELLGELNLWETFSRYLQVMSSILGEVIFKLVVPSAYDSVRIQLYELMAKHRKCARAYPG
jgi:CRP-like cAMP-binding protein